MLSPPTPSAADEPERLAALARTGLLDTPPAGAFDRITRSVAGLLDVPMALISLVDEKRQWFLSRFGVDLTETPREVSFCGHAVAARETLLVEDAWRDPRFAGGQQSGRLRQATLPRERQHAGEVNGNPHPPREGHRSVGSLDRP
jgi:GAF domain-containing protein